MEGHDMNGEQPMTMAQLSKAVGQPDAQSRDRSRQAVLAWYAETAPVIRWDRVNAPFGPLYVAVSDRGLRRVGFPDEADSFLDGVDRRARIMHDPAAVAPYATQLAEYFAGKRRSFDLPVDMRDLRPFQRSVLEVALRIPLGSVWTYSQVAQAIGKPRAARAVGQALGNNPVPIVVPCHRVIASTGRLQGYAGGLAIKQQLLALEGVAVG